MDAPTRATLDAVLTVFHQYPVVEQRRELQTSDDRLGGRAGEQRPGVRPEREEDARLLNHWREGNSTLRHDTRTGLGDVGLPVRRGLQVQRR